jgi:RNA polymerase-binding transcription factor DksA
MARACQVCRRPIARARLEAFPDATLCVDCQGKAERGENSGPAEYCPRCGNVMRLKQTRSSGVTRYVLACPQCRK